MVNVGKFFANDSNIEIMPVSGSHSAAIASLHSQLFNRGWGVGECHSLISKDEVFGFYCRYTNRNDLIGFVLARVIAEEAEILTIGTGHALQNRGLGWRMMHASISEAKKRGAEKIFLEVDDNNKAAVKLYRKIGFEKVGERRAYYDNGDNAKSNALVLELKLN